MRHVYLALCFAVPRLGLAQNQAAPIRVPAPLFDLVVLPDSTYGVQLLAAPGLASGQGHQQTLIERMALLPEDLATWLPAAQRLADSAPWLPGTDAGRRLGARLSADRGRSWLTLGYDPAGLYRERFFVRVEGGVSGRAWQAVLPDSSVPVLIGALATANATSHLVPVDLAAERALLPCELDELPVMTRAPAVRYPDRSPEGRVWVQYVIDTTGRVNMASVKVILSDGPAFEKEVRRGLKDMRFEPGRLAGRAVAVLGFQPFTFKQRS